MGEDDRHRPEVLVSDRQDLRVDTGALAALAEECLIEEGAPDTELSLSFVSADEMADLHARYSGEEGPTDVLSFPLGDEALDDGRRLLGDVVICPAYASDNNPDLASELRLLVAHGVLHLLGYDHEEEAERAEMWARQERYSGVSAWPPGDDPGVRA